MIGFFIFEDTPSIESPLVLAHSALNDGIKGLFWVREMDCKDVSSVQKGDTFFGVLDDSSGYGACLFIKDLKGESDSLLLQNSLHVKKDCKVDGKVEVKGNLKVGGQITGKSSTTKLSLSPDDIALLAAQITSMPGSLGAVKLNHVVIEMENG